MNPLIQCKPTILPLFIAAVLACFGLLPKALAVVPPPDGGYPGFNTAEGQNALFSLTTGGYNTAIGFLSLAANSTNSFNTAIGAGTLLANAADQNTATGAGALVSNTTGFQNTADGTFALFTNTTGGLNTANGALALFSNTTGGNNTANGYQALYHNTTGSFNTAIGDSALYNNTSTVAGVIPIGESNTAIGYQALYTNTTGSFNTAIGEMAGNSVPPPGDFNIYIGAGSGVTGSFGQSNSIHIGDNLPNNPGSSACYIGGIYGQAASTTAVFIDGDGHLGIQTSSKRFKEDIKPMANASEALFGLQPVAFHYKKTIDPAHKRQLGLVAEEVEKVDPDLVVRDKDDKPYSVRYDQVNAMLLNEFLKEHRRNEEQQALIERQQKQIEALTAGLQKVSDQLELSKAAPEVVNNP